MNPDFRFAKLEMGSHLFICIKCCGKGALWHSLQDRLSKISSECRDEIYLKLRTSTAPHLKLIDLPGIKKGNLDDSLGEYAEHNDAILLVVIPAMQAQ